MSDWAWVGLAHGIVYVTLLGYVLTLIRRRHRLEPGKNHR